MQDAAEEDATASMLHVKGVPLDQDIVVDKVSMLKETRRGSPVDRRPSTAEAPPIGKIRHFSQTAVTFEPLMGF